MCVDETKAHIEFHPPGEKNSLLLFFQKASRQADRIRLSIPWDHLIYNILYCKYSTAVEFKMQTASTIMAFGPLPEENPKASMMKHTESMLSIATVIDSDMDEELNELDPSTSGELLNPHRRVSVMKGAYPRESILGTGEEGGSIFQNVESITIRNMVQPHVHWGTTEIRSHAVILGCNPSVTRGPPLTIEWDAQGTRIMSVDDFEADRKPPRPEFALKKSSTERKTILKEAGFSSEEFKLVQEYIDEIKESRKESKEEKSDLSAMIAESRRRKKESRSSGSKKGFFSRFRKKQ